MHFRVALWSSRRIYRRNCGTQSAAIAAPQSFVPRKSFRENGFYFIEIFLDFFWIYFILFYFILYFFEYIICLLNVSTSSSFYHSKYHSHHSNPIRFLLPSSSLIRSTPSLRLPAPSFPANLTWNPLLIVSGCPPPPRRQGNSSHNQASPAVSRGSRDGKSPPSSPFVLHIPVIFMIRLGSITTAWTKAAAARGSNSLSLLQPLIPSLCQVRHFFSTVHINNHFCYIMNPAL